MSLACSFRSLSHSPSAPELTHQCTCLHSLAPVLPMEESKPLLEKYDAEFRGSYLQRFRAKLGLLTAEDDDADDALVRVGETLGHVHVVCVGSGAGSRPFALSHPLRSCWR